MAQPDAREAVARDLANDRVHWAWEATADLSFGNIGNAYNPPTPDQLIAIGKVRAELARLLLDELARETADGPTAAP